jgi:hypothetical protein
MSDVKPCEWCFQDWEDNEDFKGTVLYPECGDGCCWNRKTCEECGGTGEAPTDD